MQEPDDNNETHIRTFKSNFDVIKHYKGSLYKDKALIDYKEDQDIKNGESHNDDELKSIVKEKMMDTALLKRSDMSRYGPLMTNIRDQLGYIIDVYPKTLALGHDMLEDYAKKQKITPKEEKKMKMPDDKYREKNKDMKSNEETT